MCKKTFSHSSPLEQDREYTRCAIKVENLKALPLMKKYTPFVVPLVILSLFIMSAVPTAVLARENQGNQETSCLKAFGHFIALGWLKKNDAPTLQEGCTLPSGIAKLLGIEDDEEDEEDEDTTAPIISGIIATDTDTEVTISWITDEIADSELFVSETTPVDEEDGDTLSDSDDSDVLLHELELNGLDPETTYFGFVRSTDPAGNTATSDEFTFTTDAAPDETPPVLSDIASVVGMTSANVTWDTDEAATSKVFYGTVTPLDVNAVSTGMVESGLLVTNHDVLLVGLTADTTYYVIIESEDASGNATQSTEFSFTTDAAPDITPPTISNIISVVGDTTATISWDTDEDADSAVFYSTVTPVDIEAVSTGVVADAVLETSHELILEDLTAETTYYLLIRSRDAEDNTQFSSEFSFTTGA